MHGMSVNYVGNGEKYPFGATGDVFLPDIPPPDVQRDISSPRSQNVDMHVPVVTAIAATPPPPWSNDAAATAPWVRTGSSSIPNTVQCSFACNSFFLECSVGS